MLIRVFIHVDSTGVRSSMCFSSAPVELKIGRNDADNKSDRFKPNTIKSYKILQKLSPKHTAHGVAQSTYPIYRHGKACLSKQPPWRAAGDLRLARRRSRVLFFCTFPTNPAKVLGLLYTTGLVFNNPNTIKSYKNYRQNTQHMVLRNQPTLSIGTERLACLNSPPGVQLGTLA